jgi:hypothetical protein
MMFFSSSYLSLRSALNPIEDVVEKKGAPVITMRA